jgi:hypothetical protein
MTVWEFLDKYKCDKEERRMVWRYFAFLRWLESVRMAAGLPHNWL